MNNYQEDFERITTELIGTRVIFAYLSLLQDSCDYETGELNLKFKVTDKKLLRIVEFIKKTTVDLEEVMSLEKEEKDDIIENIKKYRKEIIGLYNDFAVYSKNFGIILSYMGIISTKIYLRENSKDDLDLEKFFFDCYDFLEEIEDEQQRKQMITKFMGYVPTTFTKEKFFDYIKRSFLNMENEITVKELDNMAEILKKTFNPSSEADYLEMFPEIAQKMDGYIEKLKSGMTDVEFEVFHDNIEELSDTLFQITQYMNSVFMDLNNISIILSSGVDMEYIAGTNPVYVDLYNTCKMILNKNTSQEDKDTYSEILIELLNSHLGEVYDKQLQLENGYNEKMEKYSDGYENEELESLMKLQNLLYGFCSENIDNIIFDFENEKYSKPASKECLNKKAEELISSIRDKISTLNAKERKVYMQSFMSTIFTPWDIKEFVDYMRVSMGVNASAENIVLAVNEIGNILEEEGYFEEECDCGHEHHHHHHDGGCSCGHEHHHHHHDSGCSCGHEH